MYSSSYKARSGTVAAFEDAYAKEDFLRRTANSENVNGCTPSSKPILISKNEEDNDRMCENKTPSAPCKPKKGVSGFLGGADGGDILLILLILFFLMDKDQENDGIIPILLGLLLLF